MLNIRSEQEWLGLGCRIDEKIFPAVGVNVCHITGGVSECRALVVGFTEEGFAAIYPHGVDVDRLMEYWIESPLTDFWEAFCEYRGTPSWMKCVAVEDLEGDSVVTVAHLTSTESIFHAKFLNSEDWGIFKGGYGCERYQLLHKETWHPWPH